VETDSDELYRCFLHGALAPDMGFVPGVDRFVSEVSHYVSTADLARALIRNANDQRQAAFAWGWVTHVLGDMALHPLVGRACGEALTGDRRRRLNASEDVATHVSLEVGLDMDFLGRDASIPLPPREAHFDRRGVEYLTRALEETYAVRWNPDYVLSSHRRAVRLTRGWPRALAVLAHCRTASGQRLPPSPQAGAWRSWMTTAALMVASRFTRARTAARGFFNPRQPPEWMVREVDRYATGFADLLGKHVRTKLAILRNHNLESGEEEGSGDRHPEEERTRGRLAALQRQEPSTA
jgi:hypothetical protein